VDLALALPAVFVVDEVRRETQVHKMHDNTVCRLVTLGSTARHLG
jgi:hypothetical protein